MCFGNEPSWKVDLTTPGIAKAEVLGEETRTYRGGATRNEVLKETLWRGSPDAGRDLVVFLSDKPCSDGMSEVVHPVTARVSFPTCASSRGAAASSAEEQAGRRGPRGSHRKRLAPPEPSGQGREGPGRRGPAADDAARGGPRVRLLGLQPARGLVHRRERHHHLFAAGGDHDGVSRPGDGARDRVPRGARGPLRYSVAGDRLTLKPASGDPLVFVARFRRSMEAGRSTASTTAARRWWVRRTRSRSRSRSPPAPSPAPRLQPFRGTYVVDGRA